jgi:peptide-methionine (S)-S-oxide reductase
MTLGHRELEPVRQLLASGQPMTAPIAAAFGAIEQLPALLKSATPDEVQRGLGLAVINRQTEAARLALDAGADPDVFLPVHAHCLPLHMAALHEDLPMMELLIVHGARTDIPDKLWGGTPLGWAIHENKARARAWLEGLKRT